MAQRPISSKRLVMRASRATSHYGLWHKGQFGQKVGCKTSWTTRKYGTKANIARHHGPPVIMGKGRNHRPSWAKVRTTGHHGQKVGTNGHHGQKVGTNGHHGQRVDRARDRWTTSYGTKANSGKRVGCARDCGPPVMAQRSIWEKGRLRKRLKTTSYGTKANLGKR